MQHPKLVKRSILVLIFLVALAVAGLEFLSHFYQQKAGAFFREKFTQQSDLALQPFKTTVSVWAHFPRITFKLTNLSLVDTSGAEPVKVLSIGRTDIAVPLGQFDLNRLQISRVVLTDVVFFQSIDSTGQKTGLKFKKIENPDTTGSQLPFVIPDLRIRQARLVTENHYKQSGFSVLIGEANLQANLADGILNLKGKLNGQLDSITSRQLVLFRNEPFAGSLQYAYNLKEKKGQLSQTSLTLNKNQIRLSGGHTALPEGIGANLDFKISGNQPLLYLLTQLLPPQAKTFLSEVETKSNMQFSLHITGKSNPTTSPRNLIKFALRNGDIYLPSSKTLIKQVTLVGEMDNGTLQKPETSRLTISDFSAVNLEDSFRVELQVNNFVKPTIHFSGQGRMHLAKLAGFVKLPATNITAGILVGKVQLYGTLPDSLNPQMSDWQGNGSLVLQQASFRPVGLKVDCRGVNGGIRFKDNLLQMDGLQGTVSGHPFKFQASVNNFQAYLLGQPGPIKAKANVYAALLNTEWLALDSPGKTGQSGARNKNSGAKKTGNDSGQPPLQDLESQVNLRVDNFHLPVGKKITNLEVQVNQHHEKVKLTRMRFTASGGGTATADGGFDLTAKGLNDPYLNVKLNFPELDFQEFMQNLTALKEMKKPVGTSASAKAIQSAKKAKQAHYLEEEDYRLNLQVKAGKIKYLHLTGTNLLLRASVNSQRVQISQLDFNSSGGQIHIRGNMQLHAPNQQYPVKLRAELHRVNLQQLFTMAEKMNLDILSSRNIRGMVECNLTILTNLDERFSPSIDQTTAYARATLLNLELIEVTPIQDALKILKKERTRHLYFEDLTTNFILSNNQFLTPGLRMNSNLTSFNLSGTYTMGGNALLNMDVNVMNLLVGNNKRRIEKIQSGDTTLTPDSQKKQHLLITRNQQKYKVNLSNRTQREEREVAFKKEYQDLIRKHQIDTVYTLHK